MDSTKIINSLVLVNNILNNIEVKGKQNLSNLYRSISIVEEIIINSQSEDQISEPNE